MAQDWLKQIDQDVKQYDVVLYMKGSQEAPMCGFSGFVVQVLKKLGVSFKDVNVLMDSDLRQAVKDYSKWPTLPQLYIKGEFIGGADIVRDMYQSGELQDLLKQKGVGTPS